MKKYISFLAYIFGLAVALHGAEGDVEWYISNPAGMALERASQTRALREKNALAVRELRPNEVPPEIRQYYSAPWRITCSILYEDGKRVKTQWVFRDQAQTALFVASIGDNGSGFIEWYDDQGYLVEEQRLDADGSGYFISYTYKDSILLKAEGHFVDAVAAPPEAAEDDSAEEGDEADAEAASLEIAGMDVTSLVNEIEEANPGIVFPDDAVEIAKSLLADNGLTDTQAADAPPPRSVADMTRNPDGPATIPESFVAITGRENSTAWTDFYRYTRSRSLRSIRRVFNNQDMTTLARFSRFVENGQKDVSFVETPAPYVSIFLADIIAVVPAKVDYTFDNKRRVVAEKYMDAEDNVIGELRNTWVSDRLEMVSWSANEDERRVIYTYDNSGNRVKEENYRGDDMERAVEFAGDRETERLYKDGQEILKVEWVDGRKISEERPTSVRGGSRLRAPRNP
jgi:hypothetical protein